MAPAIMSGSLTVTYLAMLFAQYLIPLNLRSDDRLWITALNVSSLIGRRKVFPVLFTVLEARSGVIVAMRVHEEGRG
jgi:hypothetical protein